MTAARTLAILILAAPPGGSIAEDGIADGMADSIVFRAAFDSAGDLNGDGWPDGWRRRVGRGFPQYVPMRLVADATAPGGHCLRVELNGGAAAAYGPPMPVSPQCAYTILAAIRTEGLRHDRAYLTWRLLDADGKLVAEHASAKVSGDTPWHELTLPQLSSEDSRARFAAVGFHVEPGDRADLTGRVSLAAVRGIRHPGLQVSTNQPGNIFRVGQGVTITCQINGRPGPDGRAARLTMEMIDAAEPLTALSLEGIHGRLVNVWNLPASGDKPSHGDALTWSPPLPEGYYRLRTRLADNQRTLAEHQTTVAVLPPLKRDSQDRIPEDLTAQVRAQGNFGWSLPQADRRAQLPELADRLGVSAIKLPLWLDEKDAGRPALQSLVAELRSRDVRVIGVLANPPAGVRKTLLADPAGDDSVASLLTVPAEKLARELQSAIMPWALAVHDWQLGADSDQSLPDSPAAAEKCRELSQKLAEAGLPVRLALPKSHAWRTLQPPPANSESPGPRVGDFVGRLVAAAVSGAEAVFIDDPLNPAHGLFQEDGSPGELLAPWYTASQHLSGARHLGRLHLPGGSENRVFQQGGQVSVVIWREQPGTEPLFIGPGAKAGDVWGRTLSSPASEVHVGPMPTFIRGGDPSVVRTQLDVTLEPTRLPSIVGQPHMLSVRVPNCFGRRVSGQVTLHLPDRWRVISPKTLPLDLPPGGEAALSFRVRLPFDGASGPQPLRLDLEIAADAPLRFSAYREIEVGLRDVELKGSARLDEQGSLRVVQQLINHGPSEVNFSCQLLIPGRRVERATLRRLPPGTHEHVYTLPRGEELVGKTLRLRADELGGQRVLSQSLVPSK
jgi:hypothetical protein